MNYFPGHPYYDGHGSQLARKSGRLIAPQLPKDGNRSWQVITQPTIEPVTVDEAKLFARIDTEAEDDLIESFIETLRMSTEDYLGRALIQQTIKTIMDFWPGNIVELPRPPLISIDSVVALDEDDAETVYDSDNYYLITEATPGQLVIKRGVTSPINTTRDWGRFVIRSKHGYGTDASDVPNPIKTGIKLWVAALYDNRTVDAKNPPPDAQKIMDHFKVAGVMIR